MREYIVLIYENIAREYIENVQPESIKNILEVREYYSVLIYDNIAREYIENVQHESVKNILFLASFFFRPGWSRTSCHNIGALTSIPWSEFQTFISSFLLGFTL